ncbi:MAG TPA: tetratricopeptide repeat protein [Flavobacteriaceae bacterium]|nr:tetratricopeptide repeat protein [Flavobacteriaceae bacterium]
MKKSILLIIILTSIATFGQNERIFKLMQEGNKAYENKNLQTAKEKFLNIIEIDPINKDALFNLAATELYLGNKDKACEYFQKSYKLGAWQAYDLINTYCNDINKLMKEGNKAFENNDFQTASNKFRKVIEIDSTHKNAFWKLANTELHMGKKDKACGHFHKLYELNAVNAYDTIVRYCGKLKYVDKMLLEHVEEMPKFKTDNGYLPVYIFKNSGARRFHPSFLKLLERTLDKDKGLKKLDGRVQLLFILDITGRFSVIGIRGEEIAENERESYRKKLESALNNIAEIIPAKYQNKNVGIKSLSALPLIF